MAKQKIFYIWLSLIVIGSLFQPYFQLWFESKPTFSFSEKSYIADAGITIEPVCSDECAYIGQPCPGGGVCGDYDSDPCLECPQLSPKPPSCTDECSYIGQTQKRCSGSYIQKRICGDYDSDPCLEWSSWINYQNCEDQGKVCQNGKCVRGCTDECSYVGQKRCADNSSYQVCGDYDSDVCLEWSSPVSCGEGKVCSGGNCITRCTSHHHKQCYNNDVYWYDSCGNREEKASECGRSGWTNQYQCSSHYLKRKYINRGCSNAQCYANEEWRTYQDCGQD
ncbi:hypothetical protein J7J74_01070, partial [bacterium]|nr:hypothetical protein [bacterium]